MFNKIQNKVAICILIVMIVSFLYNCFNNKVHAIMSGNMISNCSINENGETTGGDPGDNNGLEWKICSWSNKGYTAVYRFPDETVGIEIANLSIAAANNNYIGYDQDYRDTYWKELSKQYRKKRSICNYNIL